MAKQFVSQLSDKEPVQSIFLIKEKFLLKGKNGKAYISIALSDRTGAVDGRIWDNVDEISSAFQAGDFVRIKGVVHMFQNRRQVVVHKVERTRDGEYELRDFINAASEDPEKMMTDLRKIVDEIRDPHIKNLILNVIEDPEIRPRLLRCPAAKTIHHAYLGGLLEHILSIAQIMQFLARHYPILNQDLLIFGAIFHDIGKLWELEFDSATAYTDSGRLIGHLVMSVELIEKHSAKIADFPSELKLVLKHIVLSHHGKQEFGSPKVPQFLEAFIVAFIDDFDSKVNTIHHFMSSERQSGEKWSRFHQLFDRYFYLGVSQDQAYAKVNRAPVEEPGLLIPPNHEGLSYKKSDV